MEKIFGDLWSFPFNSQVWGNFTDWGILITTIITAKYLVKTFKSQKKVQKLQRRTTEIENERFRIENEPIFRIGEVRQGVKINNDEVEVNFNIEIHLVKNDLLNFEAEFLFADTINRGSFDTITPRKHLKESENFYLISVRLVKKDHFDKNALRGTILLKYSDLIGNLYSQQLLCVIEYSKSAIHLLGSSQLKRRKTNKTKG